MPKAIQNRIVHDEELTVRLQRGDEWAFQLLVRRFRKKIFTVAYGITLDIGESRHIVQDVFFQVYDRIVDFKGDRALSTWLFRITVMRCLNWKRRWARRLQWFHKPDKRTGAKTGHQQSADLSSAEPKGGNHKTWQLVDQTLERLADPARAVLVLRELEGLSYEEIAYVTGLKQGAVRSRLFHARRQVRAFLDTIGAKTTRHDGTAG